MRFIMRVDNYAKCYNLILDIILTRNNPKRVICENAMKCKKKLDLQAAN